MNSDKFLTPIERSMKKWQDKAIDADWQGKPSDLYWMKYNELKALALQGEQYEVLF